jgi:Family of unknown function (DUF5995)
VIDELTARMAALLEPLEGDGGQRRFFHATYQRTTTVVAAEIKRGGFADPEWVERWDVAFANLYLEALEASLAGCGGKQLIRPWLSRKAGKWNWKAGEKAPDGHNGNTAFRRATPGNLWISCVQDGGKQVEKRRLNADNQQHLVDSVGTGKKA